MKSIISLRGLVSPCQNCSAALSSRLALKSSRHLHSGTMDAKVMRRSLVLVILGIALSLPALNP